MSLLRSPLPRATHDACQTRKHALGQLYLRVGQWLAERSAATLGAESGRPPRFAAGAWVARQLAGFNTPWCPHQQPGSWLSQVAEAGRAGGAAFDQRSRQPARATVTGELRTRPGKKQGEQRRE
eukprot:363127-Chlamydomonas_euryale.AAC.6